jgi:glucokinase
MSILLAGDIGGTKTILRLVKAEQVDLQRPLPALTGLYEETYSSQEFPDLVPMVRAFLSAATTQVGEIGAIDWACFGIAGPVVKNTSKLTNLSWTLAADRLQQELHIPQISLINDFEAVGYGVLGLSETDVYTLQKGEPDPTAPIAVIGAGTGLGQGFVIPTSTGYRVFGTEGGHADFAPRSELEFDLLNYLKERNQIDRVSVERVVSGKGIVSIYQFLCQRQISDESPAMAEVFKIWEREMGKDVKTVDPAAEISKAATSQQDYLCQKAMDLFVSSYGAEAGNLALKLLPRGGLYIAGGIAAKNLPLIQRGDFMQAFLQKGRMTPVLERVPVHVVLNSDVGLIGSALCAALKHSEQM